jgi:hypothetical protein
VRGQKSAATNTRYQQRVKIVTVNFADPAIYSRLCQNPKYISPDDSEQQWVNYKENGCGKKQRSRFSDLLQARRSGNRMPVKGEIFRICPDRPWGPPSLPYNVYRVSFTGVKRPGVALTTHPLPQSRLKKEQCLILLLLGLHGLLRDEYSGCGRRW